MNIIIPIGGIGERFKKNGYILPKPFININGTPMLKYVVNSIKLQPDDKLIIIYNKELNNYDITNIIPNTAITYELGYYTSGAVETLLAFLSNYDITKLHPKTLICDCDTFYDIDIIALCKKVSNNAVVCFQDNKMLPIYSYIRINDDNIITEIKEKQPISNLANTGAYFFSSVQTLFEYCNKVIQQNHKYNNEYYTSCTIDLMLRDNHIFNPIIIKPNDFNCVGTPQQLKIYALQDKQTRTQRFCFDIDNTLIISSNDYTINKPIEKNINYLRFLKSMGHTIILYTARRMKTHNGNVGKVMSDIAAKTLHSLHELDIPYDEIYFGKPYADFYIDDRAINAYHDLEKETGFYENNIKERDFNTISIEHLEVVTKKGEPTKIKAEIYYYNNIPNKLRILFPLFIKSDSCSYTIEKINGINLSYLYVKENLTDDLFLRFLHTIHTLHQCNESDITSNLIYEHYSERLQKRFQDAIYQSVPDSDILFNAIITFFDLYKTHNKAIIRMIHGDPVFTNVIVNKDNEIKLIDMRGIVKNIPTIYGDIFYDYAKIYQSLMGYDEIMHNNFLPNKYKESFKNILLHHIQENYGKEYVLYVKLMTYSHIFTLLPLHSYDKSMKYMTLIDKCDVIDTLKHIQSSLEINNPQ
jgi:capsule biosynthesis phosphatase